MKIVVFRERAGAPLTLSLGVMAAVATLTLLVGAGAGIGIGALAFSGPQLPDAEFADWHAELDQQNGQLADLRNRAQMQADAVGKRLASMQARMLRIEAIGARVTEAADLDAAEFSFDDPVAQGGPQGAPGVDAGFADLNGLIDAMEAEIRSHERQLGLLQSALVDEQLRDTASVKGRPVTWGWMSSEYGQRVDPFTGKVAWHSGVDFAGREDSDVVAVASGVVVFAGKRSGYGLMIEVNHGDGYATRYAHHKEARVTTGEVVKKGQVIAVMGSTGRSTGPHVHFEVLKNGKTQDPARFVARRS